jgi:predicted ester cyclase
MSSIEDRNKQIAIDFWGKALNQQNFDVMAAVGSPVYSYNGEPSSLEGNKEWVISLHSEYPGLEFTFDDILAEGEKVALRWRLNAPAKGDRPAGWMTGTNILTIADGQIISNWQNGTMSDSWKPPVKDGKA